MTPLSGCVVEVPLEMANYTNGRVIFSMITEKVNTFKPVAINF
jgi:hypothetical protein